MSSLLFSDSKISMMVKSLTLDKFIQLNNIDDCNFIKIDIEGGELIILPNIKRYLEKNKPTIHLSLHPPFFKKPKIGLKKIINILKIYKNIFNSGGTKVDLARYVLSKKKLNGFFSIVVTDRD